MAEKKKDRIESFFRRIGARWPGWLWLAWLVYILFTTSYGDDRPYGPAKTFSAVIFFLFITFTVFSVDRFRPYWPNLRETILLLIAGAVMGTAWGRVNQGDWFWRVSEPGGWMAFMAICGRMILHRRFQTLGLKNGPAMANVIVSLGFLALPALFLPDPSRHLVTLALALALSVGLTAYWSGRVWGQLALSLSAVCLVVFLLELTGTVVLGLERAGAEQTPLAAVTKPAPGEMGWRRARLKQGRAEREAHWNQRCYQGRTISINRYGFRGPDFRLDKPEGVFRVLVTGGSVAFGTPGGGDGLTLRGQIERRLDQMFGQAGAEQKAEVYNLGLPALTSATELSILLNLLETKPDLVVMFTGWNDLTFAHEPGYYAEGQIGLLVPGCGGPGERSGAGVDQTSFGARNTATIPRAARQLLLLIHERVSDSSRGYHWLTGLGRKRPAPEKTGRAGGASPDRTGDDHAQGPAGGADSGVERFLANVERARLLSENQGAGFLLAVQPFRHCGPLALQEDQGARMAAIRESYLTLLERLRGQDRIKWVDTTKDSDLMEAMGSFYDSCHFDQEGYALVSETVWTELLESKLIPPLEGLVRIPLGAEDSPGAGPWSLSLGGRAEAAWKLPSGRPLTLVLPRIPQGGVVLRTALGAPEWVELKGKEEIPYRVELVHQDGTGQVLGQGAYPAGPGRAGKWLDLFLELDPPAGPGDTLRLTAGREQGAFGNLYWQRPVLLALDGAEAR